MLPTINVVWGSPDSFELFLIQFQFQISYSFIESARMHLGCVGLHYQRQFQFRFSVNNNSNSRVIRVIGPAQDKIIIFSEEFVSLVLRLATIRLSLA